MTDPQFDNTFKREKIKQRLLKTAAELWDYQETEMEGFDPVVELLFGACAVQFEKTARELHQSKTRILKRLANLLLPETLTVPIPAHAIMHARPQLSQHQTETAEQFFTTQEIISSDIQQKIETRDIYFSPVAKLPTIDGDIKYLAAGKNLVEISDIIRKETLLRQYPDNELPSNTLWLGLAFSSRVSTIQELSFYFDWKNHPEINRYKAILPFTQWFLQSNPIQSVPGFGRQSEFQSKIEESQDISMNLEKQVLNYYQDSFITLSNIEFSKNDLEFYPEEFSAVFAEEDLKNIKDKLLWVKVVFPYSIPAEDLASAICALNCLPVLNRKLEQSNRPFRVNKNLSIVPLNTKDYLLTMFRVVTEDGKAYSNVPINSEKEMQTATYALREEGVGRFDHRNAAELTDVLLNLIRDENAAFEAMGGTRLAKELMEARQNLFRLENLVKAKSNYQDVAHYLVLNAEKDENIWISFWSTLGALANRIAAGTTLKECNSMNYQSNSIKLISTSQGGKNKPGDEEKVNAFRSSMVSKGRIVTVEDLKAACYEKWGDKIKDIQVKKGVAVSPTPKAGLIRTLDVCIYPHDNQNLLDADWNNLCLELQSYLRSRAYVFSNLYVKLIR